MHEDCTPNFYVHPFDYSKSYRSTCLHVRIDGVNQPESGSNEYRSAIGRMIALRAPESPGKSRRLARNQLTIRNHFRVPLHCFKNHFEANIDRDEFHVSYDSWVDQPHSKRALRRMVREECRLYGRDDFDDLKSVKYKLKHGELLADGKKRAIGDLGVYRTNATAAVMEQIKESWSVPFVFGKLTATFIKTSTKDALRGVFRDLLEPNGRIQFFYHSDDSCVGAYCKDGLVYFNGDIKACDGSHRQPIFDILEEILCVTGGKKNCHAASLGRAFRYLAQPLVMKNKYNSDQKVKYEFNVSRLYSGSVLTTTINNLANLLIAIALQRRVPDPSLVTREFFLRSYRLAGEDVGYILKVIECEFPEDLQFLKHSPTVMVDGSVEPWMNLGTYIRGFGSISGDFPGTAKGIVREREPRLRRLQLARHYLSGVVLSRLNWGDHVFNEAFHHFILVGVKTVPEHGDWERSSGRCHSRIPVESLCVRYRCTVEDLMELCAEIRCFELGGYLDHWLCSSLYKKDYG